MKSFAKLTILVVSGILCVTSFSARAEDILGVGLFSCKTVQAPALTMTIYRTDKGAVVADSRGQGYLVKAKLVLKTVDDDTVTDAIVTYEINGDKMKISNHLASGKGVLEVTYAVWENSGFVTKTRFVDIQCNNDLDD